MRDRYASLREGLVGAWIPSVSGSGLLLPDLSGYGNNGTLTNMGPEDWVSSQYGRALDFDGANDYVFSNFKHIEPPFSVSCWVNLNTTTASGTMVALADSAVANQQYRLWYGDVGLGLGYTWNVDAFNTSYSASSAAIKSGASIGTWYNVVGIWERYNLRKIFVDTVQGTNSTLSVTNPTGINRAGLGVTVDSTPVNYLDGQLDDIRIYNRALSESEIKLLASRPGIGLRPQRRSMYYAPPTGARRRRILTSMP